jgi:hypothetical protein
MVQQGPVTQPGQEIVTIGGSEHVCQGILLLEASPTVRHGQKVEIGIPPGGSPELKGTENRVNMSVHFNFM